MIMNIPAELKYSKNDDWVRVEGTQATAGITDYAQDQLSDIVYVELPAVGETFEKDQRYGTVESVKAASDLSLPVSGTITAVNDSLTSAPEVVNKDPYDAGWMVKFTLTRPAEVGQLMDAAAYQKYCEERQH
jgi:glycine cleavage system H protein